MSQPWRRELAKKQGPKRKMFTKHPGPKQKPAPLRKSPVADFRCGLRSSVSHSLIHSPPARALFPIQGPPSHSLPAASVRALPLKGHQDGQLERVARKLTG